MHWVDIFLVVVIVKNVLTETPMCISTRVFFSTYICLPLNYHNWIFSY